MIIGVATNNEHIFTESMDLTNTEMTVWWGGGGGGGDDDGGGLAMIPLTLSRYSTSSRKKEILVIYLKINDEKHFD